MVFLRAGVVVPSRPQGHRAPESSAVSITTGARFTPPCGATGKVFPRVVPLPVASFLVETDVDASYGSTCDFPALATHCSNQGVPFCLENLICGHYVCIFNENVWLP